MTEAAIVLSVPPRKSEYEVERVTAEMTDHADPRWMYICVAKKNVGVLERAPDLALANEILTDVWQDSETRLYINVLFGSKCQSALFRIRFAGHLMESDESLTVDAMRDLAPGTVFYCRRGRSLWVRGAAPVHRLSTAFDNVTLYAPLSNVEAPTFYPARLTHDDIEHFDMRVVCGVSDEYCLK